MGIILFFFGAAVGSFINVLAMRYDPAAFLFSRRIIGGRSRCPGCGKTLRWFELIPLFSFLVQGGRCRRCKKRLSIQYLIVELLSGLIFVLVPVIIHSTFPARLASQGEAGGYLLTTIWILAFITLLLVSLIDLRLKLIPDEANVFLAILGIISMFLSASAFGPASGSFLGSYALLFGLRGNIWLNHASAAIFALFLFGILIFVTAGRGMGLGDLKLSAALGILFGWPDILVILALAFITGSLIALGAMGFNKKTLKSFLPFGPFIAVGATLVFFFGHDILRLYFSLFPA